MIDLYRLRGVNHSRMVYFPYNPTKWTPNPYDRESLKTELQDSLSVFRAFVLVGPRRVGKTSLLRYLEEFGKKKGVLTGYVNFQESWERSPSTEALVEYYTTSILDSFLAGGGFKKALKYGFWRKIEWLKDNISSIKVDIIKDFVGITLDWRAGKEKAETIVRTALDFPESLASDLGRRAVVLIDEFQELRLFKQAIPNIYGLLRSKWSEHDKTSYIVSGSAIGMLRSLITSENSPFKEFFIDRKVNPFDVDTSKEFVSEIFDSTGIHYDNNTVESISEKSGGIPKWLVRLTYDLHMMCRIKKLKRLDGGLVNKVWNELYSFRSGTYVGTDFQRDIERIGQGNTLVEGRLKTILTAMSRSNKSTPKDLLSYAQEKHVRIAKNVLFGYLDRLMAHGIASRHEGGNYTIIDPVLKEWLKRSV